MKMRAIAATALLASVLAGCTYDGGYGRGESYPFYVGGGYGVRGVGGTGARDLDPWLAETRMGQALVLARFDRNSNGEIGASRAAEANRWFRRYADTNGDLRLTDREIRDGLDRVGRELQGR